MQANVAKAIDNPLPQMHKNKAVVSNIIAAKLNCRFLELLAVAQALGFTLSSIGIRQIYNNLPPKAALEPTKQIKKPESHHSALNSSVPATLAP